MSLERWDRGPWNTQETGTAYLMLDLSIGRCISYNFAGGVIADSLLDTGFLQRWVLEHKLLGKYWVPTDTDYAVDEGF